MQIGSRAIYNFRKIKNSGTGFDITGDVNKKGTRVSGASISARFLTEADLSCGGGGTFTAKQPTNRRDIEAGPAARPGSS